jgi:hypothetical protein
MEYEPEQPSADPLQQSEEPPPFQPDPDLIAYLEHSGKPTKAEVQREVKRAESRSTTK